MLIAVSAYAADTDSRYADEYLLNEPIYPSDIMLYGIEEGDLTYTDEQGVIYKIVNNMAYVSGYTQDIQPDIIIPTSINIGDSQYYVRMIEGGAFQYCTSLKSVIVGSKVTTISGLAFEGCTLLEKVEFSDSITAITPSIFRYCTALREINIAGIQPGVKTRYGFWVEDGVLYGPAKDLTDGSMKTAIIAYPAAKPDISYAVSEETELVAAWAFSSCDNLQSVTLPPSAKVVDGYAFQYCEDLSEIIMPEGLLTIGQNAFDKCISLEKVELPISIALIGSSAFRNCTALREISITGIQSGVKNKDGFWVEDGVLYGPARDLTIPKEEDDYPRKTAIIAYPAAKTDISYTVSDKAELVAAWAFSSCGNLQSVTLPSSIKVVDGYAFQYCEDLSEIVLPEGILTIGRNALDGCLSLETVKIPESVTSIGVDVFNGCAENIIILGEPGSYAEQYAKNNGYSFKLLITFVTNGGDNVDSQMVDNGQLLTEPMAPQKMYFEFAGWYSDSDFTEKWDFNTAVQGSMNLYAKWDKIPYEISITDTGITAELIDDSPKKIFAASYDENGRMIDAVMLDAVETVDFGRLDTEGAETVRAFLWSGAERVFPLCEGAKR